MTGLTVYVFFATWCVPCRQEMPHIARLAREWRGVRFVLVAEDGPSTASQVPAFLKSFAIEAEVRRDPESELLARYQPEGSLPFAALVEEGGSVLWSHAGYQPGDERKLEAALAAQSAPAAAAASITSSTLAVARRALAAEPRAAGGIERFDVAGEAGRFGFAARLDGTLLSLSGRRESDLRLEKIGATAAFGPLRLRAGDGYAAFGHGLVLSVRKIDPLGVDTTVRGGRADVKSGPVAFTALGGLFNPQNTDPISLRTLPDPGDLVGGAAASEALSPELSVGQSALFLRLPSAAPDGRDVRFGVAGASIDVRAAHARIAAEAVGLLRRGFALAGDEPGHGAWASASVDLGAATALLEAKWYRRFALARAEPFLAYHEPPTLERDDQAVPGNADSIGGRARVDLRAADATTLHANAMVYRFTQDGTDPLEGGLALHAYTGAEQRFEKGSAALSLGVRRETAPDGSLRLSFVQVNADAALPLGSQLAVSATGDVRRETKVLFSGPVGFVRGFLSAGLTFRSLATLSLLYGYSTEAAALPVHHPGAELRIDLGRRGEVRLFAGRLLGGRVCISGTCRDVPTFEGARLATILRF